jgi:HPt (histidine-containing phosphotransfer) domain-containing protein
MDREEKMRILRELDDLPEAVYDELLVETVETVREQMLELSGALAQGDYSEMRSLAHAIRGTAANMRLYSLQKASEGLQQVLREQQPLEQIAAALSRLGDVLREVEDEVAQR